MRSLVVTDAVWISPNKEDKHRTTEDMNVNVGLMRTRSEGFASVSITQIFLDTESKT